MMRYAIYNDTKIEVKEEYKGEKCYCALCGQEVVPVCGKKIAHHWRHKTNSNCEAAHKQMTAWHLIWQNQFDEKCREVVHFDKNTNEKHIADIKTQNGLVIELQHSPISDKERISREKFYKNMIWIVDGTKYFEKFKNLKTIPTKLGNHIFVCSNPKECLPIEWLNCKVPIYFDFWGLDKHLNENYLIFELIHYNNQMLINELPIRDFLQEVKNAKSIVNTNQVPVNRPISPNNHSKIKIFVKNNNSRRINSLKNKGYNIILS